MKKTIVFMGFTLLMGACVTSPNKKAETVEPHANPFLTGYVTPFGIPPFEQISLDDYKPAILQGMDEQKKEVEAITGNAAEPDFENTIFAFDQSGQLLSRVYTVFSGQNSANTSDEMQALSKELSPLMSAHRDDISLNPKLFARVKAVYDKRDGLNLTKEQAKLLEETYKNFVRGGANLPEDKQARLRELNSEIAMLQLTFGQNMLKETNAFRLVIDNKDDLAGLPDNLIAAAADDARAAGEDGKWVFTLQNPSIMPFLQFSDKRELREKIFTGYISRGNNNNEADNKETVKKLVKARLEKARLMGYDHYAAFALDDRMAKNADNVYKLLHEVWEPTLAKAKAELADLQDIMKQDGIEGEPKGWDWRYYNEKVMKARFDIDETAVRPYLQLEKVREGMFYVANKLYGITFTELTDVPKPHEDAVAFECKEADGTHLGVLFMDYFPRASKRGGAWCGSYRQQTYRDGRRVAPLVTIVCNFTKPAAGQPALLSVDEASTMFHEFGHALHSLFRDVHYYGVAGVPRDFVELPSQVMEHWVLEPEVLKVYAKHYQTGEDMPAELVKKLEESSKYGQGFATAEYVQASILDMDYHVLTDVPDDLDVPKFESGSMDKLHALPQIPPRYRSTYFNHTMGGGYTAGYYSYMWAEVLDADAFEAYKETGDIFDQATAKRFREYVLTPGGIDDAMTMYRNFRGKEPDTTPLLKNRGLK
ncbi:MAG: M3 family metallopeptidase [Tannerella sp.]|jgi:peptidyl-dipeptidase Dcp|nr:M3 family metallopeptidase [Tannerella sp.]